MISRLQLRYLLNHVDYRRIVSVGFVLMSGATAMGTITIIAMITDLPMLFPPLGPSAFILFYTPLGETACPRSVVLAHSLALFSGLLSFWIVSTTGPVFAAGSQNIGWYQVAAIAMSIGLASMAMIVMNCVHPPAAATALIGAMGYFETMLQAGGVMAAVLLLVFEAIVFNRIIGGLPYPLWKFDPSVLLHYGRLAGLPQSGKAFWRQRAERSFRHRKSS